MFAERKSDNILFALVYRNLGGQKANWQSSDQLKQSIWFHLKKMFHHVDSKMLFMDLHVCGVLTGVCSVEYQRINGEAVPSL